MAEEHMPEVAEGPEGSDENVKHEDVPVSSAPPQTQDQVSVLTTPAAVPSFPPPKTDKPRPHVCLTCTRSFARLEHLKRHERSHTKEKPFECQSCTRCFARRDLLLRHQQKLHSATTPSSRPRNGRRESTTGVATGRVRKNSVASTTGQTMRPRANTLSHIDTTNAGMMPTAGLYSNRPFVPLHNHTNSFSTISHMSAFPGARGFGYSNNAMTMMGLPRLDTNAASADMSSGLRTAPPYAGFPSDLEFDMMAYDGQSNITINPHELHIPSMHGLGIGQGADVMTGAGMYDSYLSSSAILDEESTFDWGPGGFDHNMAFLGVENAIESSPSAMDTNSPVNYADSHLSRATTQTTPATQSIKAVWQTPLSTAHNNNSNAGHHHTQLNSPARGLNGSTHYGDMMSNIPSDHISPKSLLAQNNPGLDTCFTVALEATVVDGASIGGFPTLPFNHDSIPSTASTASMDSSMRYNSIANCGDLVTDNLRAATIASIAQFTGFGQRRQSAPVVSSPLTPGGNTKLKGFNPNTFPSTADLQRYTNAYFRFCHPHLPFFHLPTLNFESPDYSSSMWNSNSYSNYGIGGSCLLLSITAIGALYENEAMISRELFEYAKRTISSYLEGRRKVSANRTLFASANHGSESEDTPLWLVQAMLLNVVYGHNCGDKTAADVASNHCAALVSLARGAELAKPYPSFVNTDSWAGGPGHESAEAEWLEWITVEERKRTLYSIFVLSSMLVMAYNRAPALTNSEIRLDLPCDEDLWSADSAQSWRALGGIAVVKSRSVPFSGALTHLLTAAQRERQAAEHSMGLDGWRSETSAGMLRPSSFGCLVLIDALHNYIWETRQRHLGRQWTPHEIEAMHAHIEPALRAWSTAWSSNPLHVIERPNPFGAGPLPADSIPLLDLAYVRLFVDFGRSKEAYWQRDYDGMAQELANSSSSSKTDLAFSPIAQQQYSPPHHDLSQLDLASDGSLILPASITQSTRRERHLRKAAFYAADHLINSDRFGTAFIEKTSRDLPMQSVLCACDSAQVLSEWVTTLQERVGKHLGVLGNDKIEFDEVPCTLMTDDEDRKLLARIDELLLHSERTSENPTALQNARQGGYGSRILVLTSQTMARAAVWPTTKLMSRSLEIQARHIVDRVISSMS